jgi:hypothetical protein
LTRGCLCRSTDVAANSDDSILARAADGWVKGQKRLSQCRQESRQDRHRGKPHHTPPHPSEHAANIDHRAMPLRGSDASIPTKDDDDSNRRSRIESFRVAINRLS